MERDIEIIIRQVKAKLPEVKVVQMHKAYPADDDGLWWFRLPGIKKDIQVESPSGSCPFLVETDDDKSSTDARYGASVDQTSDMILAYLSGLKREA